MAIAEELDAHHHQAIDIARQYGMAAVGIVAGPIVTGIALKKTVAKAHKLHIDTNSQPFVAVDGLACWALGATISMAIAGRSLRRLIEKNTAAPTNG